MHSHLRLYLDIRWGLSVDLDSGCPGPSTGLAGYGTEQEEEERGIVEGGCGYNCCIAVAAYLSEEVDIRVTG